MNNERKIINYVIKELTAALEYNTDAVMGVSVSRVIDALTIVERIMARVPEYNYEAIIDALIEETEEEENA